jgi:hypothetical protein
MNKDAYAGEPKSKGVEKKAGKARPHGPMPGGEQPRRQRRGG